MQTLQKKVLKQFKSVSQATIVCITLFYLTF